MSKRRTYYLRVSQFWKLAALRGNETLAILLIWVILLKKRDVYDFGRVFFSFSEESKTIPDKIYFQPLGNHVANVRRLVKLWDIKDFSGNNEADKLESKKRVDEAAKIHDIGKPYRFKLEAKKTKEGNFQEFAYSFKGHRFLAESSDEWAKLLARGHHDFSVNDICRDTYNLTLEYYTQENIYIPVSLVDLLKGEIHV